MVNKQDLWINALVKDVGDDGGAKVEMVGMESPTHTVYSRVVTDNTPVTVGKVVECMVDEGWTHVVKDVLEKGKHIAGDSYPPASLLLRLGAVWLLNETTYLDGNDTHAKRLTENDEHTTPDWKDMTLRVHYVPDRFHVANEFDWSKHTKGLLVDNTVEVKIGDETPHVPATSLPDSKDGVIVYEDPDHGFAIINKPAPCPDHATISNHAEDVQSMFKAALKEKHNKNGKGTYVSLPFTADTEMSGLLLVSTSKEFASYMSKLLDKRTNPHPHGPVVARTYRCLVCVKDPDSMDKLEDMVDNRTIITHYQDPKSNFPKTFATEKQNDNWLKCQMRITELGHERFRAACVLAKYSDSAESSLAHWLWGVDSKTPAEDLGVSYVMEVKVEILTHQTHQLRGQLAALGFPIVGDRAYGGGSCAGSDKHRHSLSRMALQCCAIEMKEPKWEESDKKKMLVSSNRNCIFRLTTAWWSEYLNQYDHSQNV